MTARLLPAAALLALAAPAAAQQAMSLRAQGAGAGVRLVAPPPATRIEPDTAPPRSLGTVVGRAGNVYTIDGGTRAGANLFHSFAAFDLGLGDTARWTYGGGDPSQIRNVVSRVTGGAPSSIFGTLDSSALPNADFWFVNPAGILFGSGARINVPAMAHFSTAQEVRFDGGPAFTVATPGGSTFSVASPAAFGFLGGQGAISVEGAGRGFLGEGGRISLVAGDVAVDGSNLQGGRIELIGVGSGAGEIRVADPLSAPLGGNVRVFDSVLRLNGARVPGRGLAIGGGPIDIRSSDIGTAFDSGPDQGVSAPIDIKGGDVTIFSSLVSSATFGGEPAGDINISGKSVNITALSFVSSSALHGSTGTSGNIVIRGDDILIDDRAFVSSATQTARKGGAVTLDGGKITIDGAAVTSDALSQATAGAGSIVVRGTSLALVNGGTISSTSGGTGSGGPISIQISGPVTLSRGSIVSEAFDGPGDGGVIDIAAGSLTLLDQGLISTATFTSGNGGRIGIEAGTLTLDGESLIVASSQPNATGLPGSVDIHAGDLDIAGGSSIETGTDNANTAGTITIDADTVRIAGLHSRIASTNPFEIGGAAGTVSISARALSLIEGGEISTSATGGAAGDINILMPPDGLLTLTGRDLGTSINTSSGPGTGGRILISNPRAIISDGGSILALGQQGGANVQIQTGFFINSADRPNRVAVNGSFLLDAQVGDVSSGTSERDLSILDASGVLRGQCAAARATGRVSQLVIRPTGPYAPARPGAPGSCR